MSFGIKFKQRLVHRLHAELCLPRLHHGIDLMYLIFSDQISDGRGRYKQFHGKDPALTALFGDQLLGKDTLQDKR